MEKLELKEGKTGFVYLAGKVSGLTPEEYRKKFNDCREWLESILPSYQQVICPTDICDDNWDWFTCMEICMGALKQCDIVFFMSDWNQSKGAACEKYVAEALHIPTVFLRSDDYEHTNGYFVNLNKNLGNTFIKQSQER